MPYQKPDKPINAEWKTYAKLLPKNCGQTQYIETRRAFFAGASTLFALIVNNVSDSSNPEATAEDLAFMDTIHKEIVAFTDTVKSGLA